MIKFYMKLTKSLEALFQIYKMMLGHMAFHQHVIHISFHVSTQLILKKLIHQTLVSSPYIFQPVRHYSVAVGCFISDKRHLLLIFEM